MNMYTQLMNHEMDCSYTDYRSYPPIRPPKIMFPLNLLYSEKVVKSLNITNHNPLGTYHNKMSNHKCTRIFCDSPNIQHSIAISEWYRINAMDCSVFVHVPLTFPAFENPLKVYHINLVLYTNNLV